MLFIDFETVGTVDLKQCGARVYAKTAQVLFMAWAIDDGEVGLVDFMRGDPLPEALAQCLKDPKCLICAYNAEFERAILTFCEPFKSQFSIPLGRYRCAMVKANECGIGGSLEGGKSMGGSLKQVGAMLGSFKDESGKAVLDQMLKVNAKENEFNDLLAGARELGDAGLEAHVLQKLADIQKDYEKVDYAAIADYCKQDVVVCRHIWKSLPSGNYPNSPVEMALYHITQAMNDRGIPIDTQFADAAARLNQKLVSRLSDLLREHTDGVVDSPRQYVRFSGYLQKTYGITTGTDSDSIKRVLAATDSDALAALLNIWLESGSASSKFETLTRCIDRDTGRFHGGLRFCGAARTRRWSGQIFQPQNLKRASVSEDEAEAAVRAVMGNDEAALSGMTVDKLGDYVRSAIAAPEGSLLVTADLKGIERRSLMWLVNSQPHLDLYRDVDAGVAKYDDYMLEYASTFKVDPASVTPEQRYVGKVLTLALQYIAGPVGLANIIRSFGDLSQFVEQTRALAPASELAVLRKDNPNFDKDTYSVLKWVVNKWREANGRIVGFGRRLNDTAVRAVRNPGLVLSVTCDEGITERAVYFKYDAAYKVLAMKHPLGALYYPRPVVQDNNLMVEIAGMKPMYDDYYPGKFLENVASGLSRDIIGRGTIRAHNAGLKLIFSVHDEIITEAAEADAQRDFATLTRCMTAPIKELPGFPLAADGYIAKRFRKD